MNAVVSHAQQAGETQRGALCVIVRVGNTVRYVSAAEAREDDRQRERRKVAVIIIMKVTIIIITFTEQQQTLVGLQSQLQNAAPTESTLPANAPSAARAAAEFI